MAEILHNDLLDGIYKVAVEPERFRELTRIWGEYLSELEAKEHPELVSDFSKLEHHLNQAGSILNMVENSSHNKIMSLEGQLAKEIQPMFAVNQNGMVEVVNQAAQAHLNIRPDVTLLELNFTEDTVAAIGEELAANDDQKDNDRLRLLQIRQRHNDRPIIVSLSNWQTVSGRKLILLKATNIVWPNYLTPVIMKAFGLTQAEADIVRLLVEGSSANVIAKSRGSRISTVRSQIRTVYKKTATNNQAELIRMAIGLTTLQMLKPEQLLDFEHPGAHHKPIAYPHLEHMRQLSLPDGRHIEYAVFGAKNGRPVLYFHNELLGNIWPYKLAEYATMRGLRIIIPSRPFYGQSTAYPPGCFHPTQTAHDFAAVLDYLDIPAVMLMGQTLGGMFAMAFADLYPERSLGLLSLCPMLPHLNDDSETQMPPMHRFISSILRRRPALLEFIGRAGNAYYKRIGPIRFLHHAFGDLECDVPILNDKTSLEGLIRGIGFGELNAHKGYVAGYSHLIYKAEDMLRDIDIPLHVMIGDCDGNTRLARAKALIEKGIDLNIIIADGGGELLKYSHPKLIVDSLCEIFKTGAP